MGFTGNIALGVKRYHLFFHLPCLLQNRPSTDNSIDMPFYLVVGGWKEIIYPLTNIEE